ncbi:hypothetical protein [Pseudomonas sp. T1.Ur]|uniref:hypothetical protein n=1 Tax=Pseudomonas sp. T1.Ur TaxID=2928704 RepID=UPI00201D972E|nr:hypothetical protein [Pseudomonas sp. T1.Ur]MCL6702210.1 hypothetical protein [Pseudomonas sp. T1.Ur]
MDERVAFIKHRIRAIVIAGDCDQITYQSEWLGYMPFPVDHWIEHQGKTFSGDFPFDWTLDDLASLERTGFLEKLEAYENPEDRFDRHIRYRVHVECT